MGKPDDIPQWAWDKAREGIPPVYFKMEGMSPTLHVLRVGIAKAILAAVEEEREACARLIENFPIKGSTFEFIEFASREFDAAANFVRNRKGA